MFGAIILTFVITALLIFTCLFREIGIRRQAEADRLRRELDYLNGRMNDLNRRESQRREAEAYQRGLYDGRETDGLYRKFLSRYSAGEQATMMMNGDEEPVRRV